MSDYRAPCPRRLLFLGGSWFVGSALITAATEAGHDVTVFNRGRAANAYPTGVKHVRGNWESEEDVARLASLGPWDAVIDVAGVIPSLVQRCAYALAPVADRYVFMSTISAYRDWPYEAVDESSPLWDGDPDWDPGTRTWDPDAYGPLKVGCELAVSRAFGADRVLVLRPHVVLGPREYVGRLPWWLARVDQGGRLVVPAPDRSIQPVDVRDLAAFALNRAEALDIGVYNVAAPPGRDSFSGLLDVCREVTGGDVDPVWVEEEWLIDQGITQWTELPLWRALPTAWSMATDRAEAVGLRCRPLRQTVADTWAWMQAGGRSVEHERTAEHGLTTEREAELLAAWDRLQQP
ncbi:NAD-dependent epimerase/dehydratase family protein [Kribbella yunnanensis]|uniref:NAD-dependent epimerase/dehydratase family protein n=1 Tax=Kribbella yunnanensis TaxID=190194 RepID=A0ABP4TZ57_9ACTN